MLYAHLWIPHKPHTWGRKWNLELWAAQPAKPRGYGLKESHSANRHRGLTVSAPVSHTRCAAGPVSRAILEGSRAHLPALLAFPLPPNISFSYRPFHLSPAHTQASNLSVGLLEEKYSNWKIIFGTPRTCF